MSPDYDVIVIGSGFGGSVTALRLSEKGYRVGVLEQGARWRPEDYPPDSVPMRKTMWQPYFGLTGPLRLTVLKNVAIQSAVGVGGGSLVYGNVLYEPPEQFYNDPQWASITNWKAELAPYYGQAKRMLGVATNPRMTRRRRHVQGDCRRFGYCRHVSPDPGGCVLRRARQDGS